MKTKIAKINTLLPIILHHQYPMWNQNGVTRCLFVVRHFYIFLIFYHGGLLEIALFSQQPSYQAVSFSATNYKYEAIVFLAQTSLQKLQLANCLFVSN
jgi:hypothetical protein